MLIPLPFVTAIICLVLALRLSTSATIPRLSRIMFVLLFAITTIGSALVGLRFGYGVDGLIGYQRPLPLFIGPSMYLGFSAMQTPLDTIRIIAHFMVAGVLAAIASVWTDPLDIFIALSYAAYWVLLWRQFRRGTEGMAALPVEAADQMRPWLAGALALLAAIFLLENAIALAFLFGAQTWVAPIITYGSLPILAVQFWAIMKVPTEPVTPKADIPADALSDIDALMAETRLYRDPELSLSRLARRLGQPVKQVSSTINGATGSSVSHYINGWRIEEACELLRTTNRKVDDISQACGFLSRSNFYREFQRIHAKSPATYRKQQLSAQ